jgi:hypothetical protein
MTQDEIIEMARQAGLEFKGHGWIADESGYPSFEAFAKLVAAKEREACAELCDQLQAPPHVSDDDMSMWDVTSMECADAIRARGEA